MAKKNTDSNLVDISSHTQVIKVYNKKGRALRIVSLVLSILFLVLGVAIIVGERFTIGSVNFKEKKEYSDDTVKDSNSLKSDQLQSNDKILNIMLFGEDDRQGEEYGRTDTMILLSIDNAHKRLKLTSFQRDTYVYIPSEDRYDKINASYTAGGAGLSIKTIEANFGIEIDKYAIVDFDGFKNIINTLGGIELELTADEIEYINYQMYKNEQTEDRNTIKSGPGLVKLNGQEALWYARNRGLTKGEDGNEIGLNGDDWDRTSRQRKLLTKLVSDMKNADPVKIIQIATSIGPMITTDLTKKDLTVLLTNAPKYLGYEVVQNYVPNQNLWYYNDDTPSGSVIEIIDMKAQRRALGEFILEDLCLLMDICPPSFFAASSAASLS